MAPPAVVGSDGAFEIRTGPLPRSTVWRGQSPPRAASDLANRDGVVRKIWVGQLPERAEQEVLELVSGRIAVQ